MTQIGEGSFKDDELKADAVDDLYLLRFKIIDEGGRPIIKLPFKTVKTGTSAEPLHIADGITDYNGSTPIVSTTKNESIDFHIVWAKLNINKDCFKTKAIPQK